MPKLGDVSNSSAKSLGSSFWHVSLLCLLVSAPSLWFRTALNLFGLQRPNNSLSAELTEIVVVSALFLFTYLGMILSGLTVSGLVGQSWRRLPSLLKDLNFAVALVLCFVFATLLIQLLGPMYRHQSNLIPRTSLELGLALLNAIGAGFMEEIVFRGYLLQQFYRVSGSIGFAIGIQALLFAVAHGFDQTLAGFLHKFVGGLIFAWPVLRYRGLLPGILAHCIVDFSATLLLFFL